MIPTNVIPFPEIQYTMRCGACPDCGRSDGFLNLGKEHWFICREHKNKWLGGYNLFESWKDQTVAQTQGIEALLASYKEVLPLRYKNEERRLKKQNF